MRQGGRRGNCSECHRERMKPSPVLNSNPEMKAYTVKRQDIHHLTVDLKTLKGTSSELLSSCLLGHKTPNCLKSLTAQHTHVKMHASVWTHDKLQPYRLLRRGYFQSMSLYRSTLKYFQLLLKSVRFSCQTFENPGEITSLIVIHILSAYVLGTGNVLGSSSIFLPSIYIQKITALAKIITLALCRSYLTFQYSKRFTHMFLSDFYWLERYAIMITCFPFPSTQMLLYSTRQTSQTAKLNGLAANWLAPFPMGPWLKSSSDNKWSENLFWPDSHLDSYSKILS